MHILEKYILDNNLNLAELANILDYDTGNLSRVINGKTGISPRLANTIRQKLQLDIEETKRPKRYNTNTESSIQSNIQTQKPNNIMQQNSDYKDVAMKSMAQRIQELENKVIELTKNSIEDELKPKSREVG